MHKKNGPLWLERIHVRWTLVAHVNLDPRIGGPYHRFVGDKARRLCRSSERQTWQSGSARGQAQELTARKVHDCHRGCGDVPILPYPSPHCGETAKQSLLAPSQRFSFSTAARRFRGEADICCTRLSSFRQRALVREHDLAALTGGLRDRIADFESRHGPVAVVPDRLAVHERLVHLLHL